MKKSFAMQDLDCANCAAKMEAAIKKIDGVNDCSVNFFAQKMILDADDARFEDIVAKAAAAIRKVDPDCRLIVK
ncbi:MAG: heavy-metal-associated domain-containing protein [Ruminococcaceae bacterium]|nr:heavy-metal-associated domain-containing protein [Oscillospiraceae bacterium]MBQ7398646.1 cation transporter [Clostridia bacterium]